MLRASTERLSVAYGVLKDCSSDLAGFNRSTECSLPFPGRPRRNVCVTYEQPDMERRMAVSVVGLVHPVEHKRV